jgi:hypothetical protein
MSLLFLYNIFNFPLCKRGIEGDFFNLGNSIKSPLAPRISHVEKSKIFFQMLNLKFVKIKKPPVSSEKSGFLPETTKPRALGACGLYLLFLFPKDTERQTP